jgi:hypothetical protein
LKRWKIENLSGWCGGETSSLGIESIGKLVGGGVMNSTSWEWVFAHPLHSLAKGRLGGSLNKFVRGKGRLIGRCNIERKGKFVGRYGCFREEDTQHSFYFITDCYCVLGCKQPLCFVWFFNSFKWY